MASNTSFGHGDVIVPIMPYPVTDSVTSIRPAYEKSHANATGGGRYHEHDWRRISYVLDRLHSGGDLLDVGIGAGHVVNAAALSRRFRSVTGVDKKRYANFLEVADGIDVRTSRITKLPFDDDSFDVVTCLEVLEHVNDDELLPGIAELRRVCRGQLVITVPFREREPLSATHLRRFVEVDVERLFPTARATVLRRPGYDWVLVEERFDGSMPTQPSPVELLEFQVADLEAQLEQLKQRKALRAANWLGGTLRWARQGVLRRVRRSR